MKSLWRRIKDSLQTLYGGPWYKKILVWLGTLIVAFILFLIAVDCNFLWLFGRSPGFSEIYEPTLSEASVFLSSDGEQLGTYYDENRKPVTYEEISPIIVRMLVSTEDQRFYKHHGIDFTGVFAAFKDMFTGHARGASTITQQLAKNLFKVRRADGQYSPGLLGHIPGLRMLNFKAKEWLVAIKLEMVYSKEDIITMYLNTVDFGCNSYGIKTACETYFNTTPYDLTYEQAATLVGLLKATNYYNPIINPENCEKRRNVVLDNLYANKQMVINAYHATETQLDSLKALPLGIVERKTAHTNLGSVPYFRNALEEHIRTLCVRDKIEGYSAENMIDVYREGLTIYTTLDSRMQKYAEEAVMKQMRNVQNNFDSGESRNPWDNPNNAEVTAIVNKVVKTTTEYKYLVEKFGEGNDSVDFYLRKKHPVTVYSYNGPKEQNLSVIDSVRYMLHYLHCGFVAIEPDTRHVKAWVGDINYRSWEYDKVLAKHQPGSTFKLFVYTEAINQGLNPCDRRVDEKKTYRNGGTAWTPNNANRQFSGANLTLKTAFANSVNTIAVTLGVEAGIHNVARTANAMGIESKLTETYAMCLGASEVSLFELVNSYCTIANDGKYNMPIMVSKIVDHNGYVIYEAKTDEKQAVPYRSAFLMQKMLMNGLNGTSRSLRGYIDTFTDTDFGGKTGTTSNNSDGWYVGVTPGLVAGGWVGGEYRNIHFASGARGAGGVVALPIFGNFMKKVLSDRHLRKYRKKFDATPRENIDPSCWTCDGYNTGEEIIDTTEVDTMAGMESLPGTEGEAATSTDPTTPVETPIPAETPAAIPATAPKTESEPTKQ